MIKFTEDNTQDNDFRVLGEREVRKGASTPEPKGHERSWRFTPFVAAAAMVLMIGSGIHMLRSKRADAPVPEVPTVFEPVDETIVPDQSINAEASTISEAADSIAAPYTEHILRVVNDITLDIYIPHNAHAQLMIGTPDIADKSIIFAVQAADIRADNGKIVGAFVNKGEPLSYGLSKRGYCGIIEDKVTVGVADNSPLFEEATEKEGYFFRQYPLVDNGTLVENEPKGKTVRKAICQKADETFVVISATPESFHDFSQALVDLGVDNAIYLVGSEYSYGFTRDIDGAAQQFAERFSRRWKYENYLVWRE